LIGGKRRGPLGNALKENIKELPCGQILFFWNFDSLIGRWWLRMFESSGCIVTYLIAPSVTRTKESNIIASEQFLLGLLAKLWRGCS
jgi:hypothetical protein